MLHRFQIHSAMELSRTALLGGTLAAKTRGCLLVIRQFQVVVVQNGEEMYKKVCCTCEVVALPSKPIVSFTFSLPLRCRIVKVLITRRSDTTAFEIVSFFSRNGLFSDGQKMGKRFVFSFNLGLWVCQCIRFCDNVKGTVLFLCSVQPVIRTWIGFPEITNTDEKRSIEPQLLWQERA